MVVASNNKGKIEEIKSILNEEVYSLKDKNINIEVEEDGLTFVDNAIKKAKAVYEVIHEEIISDDSGLCVDCLDGFPDVLTHRFLGDKATDVDRNNYLIEEVNKHNDRSCKFICNIVYYDGKDIIIGEGILEGKIAKTRRGDNGFGFDEIFELNNGKTLAEISSKEKNEVSARVLAINDLKEKLARR